MKLIVLSPLHIGNGNKVTPLDIYPSGNSIYVLNVEKLFNDLQKLGVSLEEILDFLQNPPGEHYVWKGYIEKYRLNPAEYSLYSLPVFGEPGKTSMQINEFIKFNGRPYLPGSSLKGAIRTAILYKVLKDCGSVFQIESTLRKSMKDLISQNPKRKRNIQTVIENMIRYITYPANRDILDYYTYYLLVKNIRADRADDVLEGLVFGFEVQRDFRYEPKRDPMRGLILRDSENISRKHLAVYRVETVGNPSPIPIWVEALQPGTETKIELKFSRELLTNNAGYFNGLLWECLKERGKPGVVFEDFVWEAVREFYGAIIEHELRNLPKFGKYRDSVHSFYEEINGKKKILRLGWGSGWISTTIGLLLIEKGQRWEEVRKKLKLGKNPKTKRLSQNFPKTRRLADGKPMGWVMVK